LDGTKVSLQHDLYLLDNKSSDVQFQSCLT